jgi:hypothetical protein
MTGAGEVKGSAGNKDVGLMRYARFFQFFGKGDGFNCLPLGEGFTFFWL